MITDTRANAMLNTEYATGDKMSLHSAYSVSGASEITGGSYAKQTITWAAAASRAKSNSGSVAFSVPAAAVVAFIGIWDTTAATFRGMVPNGGTEYSFQVDLTNNRVYVEGSGYANDDRVVFLGTPPAGLTVGTLYYVVGVILGDPDYFQVAATQGGSAIDITTQASSDATCSKVVIETYAGAGTHTVTTFTAKL